MASPSNETLAILLIFGRGELPSQPAQGNVDAMTRFATIRQKFNWTRDVTAVESG